MDSRPIRPDIRGKTGYSARLSHTVRHIERTCPGYRPTSAEEAAAEPDAAEVLPVA